MVKDLIFLVISCHLSIPSPMMICRIPITNMILMGTDQLDQSSSSSLSPGVIPCYIPCAIFQRRQLEARVAKQSADVFLTSYGTFRCSVAALTRGSPVDPWDEDDEGISWKSADTVQSPCVGWMFLFKTRKNSTGFESCIILQRRTVEIDPLGLNQMAIFSCVSMLWISLDMNRQFEIVSNKSRDLQPCLLIVAA